MLLGISGRTFETRVAFFFGKQLNLPSHFACCNGHISSVASYRYASKIKRHNICIRTTGKLRKTRLLVLGYKQHMAPILGQDMYAKGRQSLIGLQRVRTYPKVACL
jgi:hypothetical protein